MIILSAYSPLGRDQWPTTLPCPAGLGDYTQTPLIGICRTIFPSANGVHQTGSCFNPVESTGALGGYQTHELRLTTSGGNSKRKEKHSVIQQLNFCFTSRKESSPVKLQSTISINFQMFWSCYLLIKPLSNAFNCLYNEEVKPRE